MLGRVNVYFLHGRLNQGYVSCGWRAELSWVSNVASYAHLCRLSWTHFSAKNCKLLDICTFAVCEPGWLTSPHSRHSRVKTWSSTSWTTSIRTWTQNTISQYSILEKLQYWKNFERNCEEQHRSFAVRVTPMSFIIKLLWFKICHKLHLNVPRCDSTHFSCTNRVLFLVLMRDCGVNSKM